MCWQAACDQAVVGDHDGWINGQTIDAIAGERGDDVQRIAKVVGDADDVLLQIERVEQRGQTGSVSVGDVVDMDVDVSTDDDSSTLQHHLNKSRLLFFPV